MNYGNFDLTRLRRNVSRQAADCTFTLHRGVSGNLFWCRYVPDISQL